MQFLGSPRTAAPAVLLGALATIAAAAATTSAAARPATTAQRTVTASLITRRTGTLAPGTKVKAKDLGQRVFVDASHGFALASVGQAQYPAATTNGGKSWKTDGPALHINAAQAPLGVTQISASSRTTAYAYGSGQVIDTTSDGGKKWYGALFNEGDVMAVVPGPSGHLVAFVDGPGVTWQYVSKNGGRSWRYTTTEGAF